MSKVSIFFIFYTLYIISFNLLYLYLFSLLYLSLSISLSLFFPFCLFFSSILYFSFFLLLLPIYISFSLSLSTTSLSFSFTINLTFFLYNISILFVIFLHTSFSTSLFLSIFLSLLNSLSYINIELQIFNFNIFINVKFSFCAWGFELKSKLMQTETILVHPKYEIIMVLSNCKFSDIAISFTPHKVINLLTLQQQKLSLLTYLIHFCIRFLVGSWLHFYIASYKVNAFQLLLQLKELNHKSRKEAKN